MPIITVQFIEDVVATPEQKKQLIVELTNKFVEILGDVVRPFVDCVIQETPQQEWGIAGVPMPDLVYRTSDQHSRVIDRSNTLMCGAVAQMQAAHQHSDGNAARGDESAPAQPPAAPETVRIKRSREAVHRFIEAVNTKQRDVLFERVHPNFVDHGGAAGDISGPRALIDSLNPFFDAMPDWHISEDYVVAQGDRMALRGTSSGTHQGAFMDAPPTGKKVSWTGS